MKKLIFVMAVLPVAAGCGSRISGTSESEREPVSVKVLEVSGTEASAYTLSYVGTAKAARTAVISSRHSGTLVSLNVRQGEKVSKGQVIAVIESQNVKSSYEMTRATLEQAEDGYRRAQQVYGTGSISDVKMVEVTTQLNQAKAAAAASEKALEDCTIKAPFDAYVSDVLADEGTEVDMFGGIARLMDISEVEVHFSVPETELGKLSCGDEVTIDIAATGATGIRGRVSSIGISASPLSHSYDCTVTPGERAAGLMPGMVCKIFIDKDRLSGAVIPASVLQTGTEGRYLWVVEDGIVRKRIVKVGGFSGKGVLILDGLEEGDLVIVEGYRKVSSGMKVRIG